ncbi:YcdB/YcdC domain-containing protein [Candidatus Avoscillospira sp. LCP25S3_F1]|uniref:YcdB/YcdC domain-containing protein n=1 Tax=Candidatus Avoscillospira sp. LCP25S3_F1 TaxID=3438825 RepID=UPI003F8F3232
MKKLTSLLLSLAVLATAVLPVAAATDQRLTQVTQAVKETLSIDDGYDTFYGELEETTFQSFWSLNWEGEGRSLRVSASEDGTVYRYNYSDSTGSTSQTPSFPEYSPTEAQTIAQEFLDTVVTAPLGVQLEDTETTGSMDSDRYYFYGNLTLHGYPTPVGLSVSVDSHTGQVLSYRRDDRYDVYLPYPAASAALTEPQTANASNLLKGTLALRLEYVLDNDSETAVLRYLPEDSNSYYVDAATGQLVDLTALYGDLSKGEGTDSSTGATAEDSANSGLTDSELEGIAQMKDVKDKDTLDQAVRAYSELGLSGYTLNNCSYALNRETQQVTATLRYSRSGNSDGPDAVSTSYAFNRSVTVDAKTGEILSSSGTSWADEDFQPTVSPAAAQAKAEAFLQKLWGDDFAKSALYDTREAGMEAGLRVHTFTYAQQVNGYFFPQNTLTIAIDGQTGDVINLYRDFEAAPTFDSADGILTEEAALDAWFATFDVVPGYTRVPVALSDYGEQYRPLLDQGYTYVHELKLGYTLSQKDYYLGIDAKSGDAVAPPVTENSRRITYSDMEGSWGQDMAQALADYGVGWLGGKLEPDKPLTQLDLMALLLSTRGILLDLEDADSADAVYDYAYAIGLLTASDRRDSAILTRGELVQYLLDANGFGEAARLPDIFRCDYTDAASIPDALFGYAAIAQGLGMVTGDSGGNFSAGRTVTRLETIAMLYRLLSR